MHDYSHVIRHFKFLRARHLNQQSALMADSYVKPSTWIVNSISLSTDSAWLSKAFPLLLVLHPIILCHSPQPYIITLLSTLPPPHQIKIWFLANFSSFCCVDINLKHIYWLICWAISAFPVLFHHYMCSGEKFEYVQTFFLLILLQMAHKMFGGAGKWQIWEMMSHICHWYRLYVYSPSGIFKIKWEYCIFLKGGFKPQDN